MNPKPCPLNAKRRLMLWRVIFVTVLAMVAWNVLYASMSSQLRANLADRTASALFGRPMGVILAPNEEPTLVSILTLIAGLFLAGLAGYCLARGRNRWAMVCALAAFVLMCIDKQVSAAPGNAETLREAGYTALEAVFWSLTGYSLERGWPCGLHTFRQTRGSEAASDPVSDDDI